MNANPRKIQVFQYNPPLKVIAPGTEEGNPMDRTDDFRFARPKLKRQIAHDRVSRYFRRSANRLQSQLD
ncbi:MAG: hypothetical protein CBD18_04700 [Opitutales bacterium TMED158]|nr:MAG: hypothetical protein CBD18_04700 [Opitutales bacterium TMED158]